jgi:VWFA-related protein
MSFSCTTPYLSPRFTVSVTAAILVLVAQILVAQILVAQLPTLKTRTKEERESQYQSTRRITLNVQVTDAAGKPVTDLAAKDFILFDNQQPRKLAAFHAIDGEAMNDATEVVIVLDAVNSSQRALEAEKTGIFKFLAKSHAPLPYPTSFVLWSNGHLKATSATTDRNAVGRAFVSITKNIHSNACTPVDGSAMKTLENSDAGAHSEDRSGAPSPDATNCLQVHFKDSVAALDGMAQQQIATRGRTLLIWVGPGWPLLSSDHFQQLAPKARANYFQEIVNVLHDLRAAQVTLDSIDATEAAARDDRIASEYEHALTAGAASPESARPGSLALPVLALETGGRMMTASSDVVGDLGKLLNDADWYYALSFNPPPAQSGIELRSLEVKVSRPGLDIRTMTRYYNEP